MLLLLRYICYALTAFTSMTVLTGTICDDIRLCLFSEDKELLKY